jgi:hypothetical protein
MITKKHIGKHLLSVLEKYEATQQYLDNCNRSGDRQHQINIRLLKNSPFQLADSFDWKLSPEKEKFWLMIEDEAYSLLRNDPA